MDTVALTDLEPAPITSLISADDGSSAQIGDEQGNSLCLSGCRIEARAKKEHMMVVERNDDRYPAKNVAR